jgi:hypothetical protein
MAQPGDGLMGQFLRHPGRRARAFSIIHGTP